MPKNNDVITPKGSKLENLDLPEGTPKLVSIYLYAVTGCNLCCRHCWITPTFVNGKPDPGDCIDLNLFKTAVREALPLGLQSVKLTGGEPMIHPQFREIALFLKQEGLQSDMETNGTCIDADIAYFMKYEADINFISISLDSIDPTKHDKLRGRTGAFENTLNGIKYLVDVGYKPQIIMALHRSNIGELDEMVELASKLGAGSVKFNPVINVGRGRSMKEAGECLNYDETRKLIRYVYGTLPNRSQLPVLMGAPMALLTVRDLIERKRGRCNVEHILGILGTGHMALCGIGRNVPELCYGKLGEDDLRDVWISHPLLLSIRIIMRDGDFPGICSQCIHAYSCRTICLAMNYMDSGKLFSPSTLCREAELRGEFPLTRRR